VGQVRQLEFKLTDSAGGRIDPTAPGVGSRAPARFGTSTLERWCLATAGAPEACVVLDREHRVMAASDSWCTLMGVPDQTSVRGHPLLSVVRLLDFADGAELDDGEASKIPPLLAIKSRALARGLVRVPAGSDSDSDPVTLDSIATPLLDGDEVAGSLSFFSKL
jgi:PAS domain-containing protein